MFKGQEEGSQGLFYQNRILVVDDAVLNRKLTLSYLEQAGFKHLASAVNTREALEKVENFQPNIIILDLLMLHMDGVQFIKFLRDNLATKHLPIIVQTDLSNPQQWVEAWQSGANDIITKPIHCRELLSRVRTQLEHATFLKNLEDYHFRAQEDINQALEVQQSLLPSTELIGSLEKRYGLKIDSLFVPSRFLSGDIWGILDVGSNQIAIWICDFSGKGIRAALHTFRLHTLIQEFKYCADDPGEIIDALNTRLVKVMPQGQFSTFLVGVINFEKNLFTYTSASATHPLMYFRHEKKFQIGDGTGIPLGIVDQPSYPLRTIDFPKGAALVLYSDFLWEGKGLPGISFSIENLPLFARELKGKNIVESIRQQVKLLDDPSFSDDLTLIEVMRLEA
jgi:phosphoserine phosphatase RsbU/P